MKKLYNFLFPNTPARVPLFLISLIVLIYSIHYYLWKNDGGFSTSLIATIAGIVIANLAIEQIIRYKWKKATEILAFETGKQLSEIMGMFLPLFGLKISEIISENGAISEKPIFEYIKSLTKDYLIPNSDKCMEKVNLNELKAINMTLNGCLSEVNNLISFMAISTSNNITTPIIELKSRLRDLILFNEGVIKEHSNSTDLKSFQLDVHFKITPKFLRVFNSIIEICESLHPLAYNWEIKLWSERREDAKHQLEKKENKRNI